MRHTAPLLLAPLAALTLAAAARPAAAQQRAAGASDYAAPAAVRPAADVAARARLVAVLHLDGERAPSATPQVTIADSAGVLVAAYHLGGTAVPLALRIDGTDLVLRGTTPDGRLAVRLFGANAPDPAVPIRGRWSVGPRAGVLQQVATR